MAGDYEVFSSVLAQYGVVEARDEFEMIPFCEALCCYPNPIAGKVGIITGSGGHGAMAVDACLSHGLSVPALAEEIRKEFKAQISPRIQAIASLNNPIDLTGSAVDDDFVNAANFLSKREEVDCLLILLLPYVPGITSDLGARLSQITRQTGKPTIAYVPHVEKYLMFVEGFQLNQIPVAHSIEEAVHMAEALRRNQPC
jgi:acyl-CoA synthetase (NDP forming)